MGFHRISWSVHSTSTVTCWLLALARFWSWLPRWQSGCDVISGLQSKPWKLMQSARKELYIKKTINYVCKYTVSIPLHVFYTWHMWQGPLWSVSFPIWRNLRAMFISLIPMYAWFILILCNVLLRVQCSLHVICPFSSACFHIRLSLWFPCIFCQFNPYLRSPVMFYIDFSIDCSFLTFMTLFFSHVYPLTIFLFLFIFLQVSYSWFFHCLLFRCPVFWFGYFSLFLGVSSHCPSDLLVSSDVRHVCLPWSFILFYCTPLGFLPAPSIRVDFISCFFNCSSFPFCSGNGVRILFFSAPDSSSLLLSHPFNIFVHYS